MGSGEDEVCCGWCLPPASPQEQHSLRDLDLHSSTPTAATCIELKVNCLPLEKLALAWLTAWSRNWAAVGPPSFLRWNLLLFFTAAAATAARAPAEAVASDATEGRARGRGGGRPKERERGARG